MGDSVLLAAAGKSSSTNLLPLLIIVVLFGVLYMTMIRPQRNRQRNAQQMQRTVEPGARKLSGRSNGKASAVIRARMILAAPVERGRR